MTNFYTQNYIDKTLRQKRRCLAVYLTVAIVLSLVIISTIVLNAIFPYNYGHRPILLAILITATVILVLFSFIYLQIVYGKVAAYLNFLGTLLQKISVTSTATVIRVNGQVNSLEIDYYSIDVLEWSSVKQDYVERTIFIDAEFKNLGLEKNDIITVTTASNYMLAYKKGVN